MFRESSGIGAKRQTAEWLIAICKAQGNEKEILEYSDFLVPFANQEPNESAIKSQLTELYKTLNQRRQELLHQQEKTKILKWALVIIVGFLALLSIIAILNRLNKRKRQHLEVQIKEEQLSHKMQQKSLSGRLKKSNETLREALIRIEDYEADRIVIEQGNTSPSNGMEKHETFRQTPVCVEITGRAEQLHSDNRMLLKTDINIADYRSFALSEAQLVSLLKVVESCFPEIIDARKAYHPAPGRKELSYLSLYLLQLDKMSICVFLQETYHTCRRYTRKLEQAFNCQYGLTTFLLEQINTL